MRIEINHRPENLKFLRFSELASGLPCGSGVFRGRLVFKATHFEGFASQSHPSKKVDLYADASPEQFIRQ